VRGPVIGPGVSTRPRAGSFSTLPAGKNARARGVGHMTWPWTPRTSAIVEAQRRFCCLVHRRKAEGRRRGIPPSSRQAKRRMLSLVILFASTFKPAIPRHGHGPCRSTQVIGRGHKRAHRSISSKLNPDLVFQHPSTTCSPEASPFNFNSSPRTVSIVIPELVRH